MTAKTRAELKAENASDFPDNITQLISAADLRGQMDDVVDSAMFPEDLAAANNRIVTIADATYTLSNSDNNATLVFSNMTAEHIALVVPTGLPPNFNVRIVQAGVVQVVVTPVNTTVKNIDGNQATLKQYAKASLTWLSTDIYLLDGETAKYTPPDPTLPIPVNTELPVITVSGSLLTVSQGIWTNDPGQFFFAWRRGTTPIDGAVSQSYSIVDDDIGAAIAATVTARNEGGDGVATSLPYTPAASAPVNTALPTIQGGSSPPKVGETLALTPGTWSGQPAPAFTYQWKSSGVAVSGATQNSYTITADDLADTISVTVMATNSAGSASATSAATAAVVAGTDTTGPVLSAFTVTPNGETGAFLSVSTTEGDGTFYWTVQPDGITAPSAAQVKAGQNGTGAAATSAGSFLVASVDTWGNNPAGLSAGTVYDAYGAMYDAAGNASNVVTAEFTTAGGAQPVLSTQSAVDFSDIFVWLQVTTNNGNGTMYAVVQPEAMAAPTATQIKAGQNGTGAAAPAGNQALTTPGTKRLLVRGLTANTAYRAYLVQNIPAGDSNIVQADFKSDVLVKALVTDGTATGLAAPTTDNGSEYVLHVADPFGGTNAVNWSDNGVPAVPVPPATTAPNYVTTNFGVSPYFLGVNKFHFIFRHVSGAAWTRVQIANVTHAVYGHFNVDTGQIGAPASTQWTGGIVAYPIDANWMMISGAHDLAQGDAAPDLFGIFNLWMATTDNAFVVPTRDGTHSRDIFQFRVTRAA